MGAFSNYLEEQVLTHIFRTSSYTKPSVLAICLLTSAASETSTGNLAGIEVANSNNYSRQVLNPLNANWSSPTGTGLTDNVTLITFPTASGSWGTITGVAVTDSATYGAGNLLFFGTLVSSKTITSGEIFKFNIGELNIALD